MAEITRLLRGLADWIDHVIVRPNADGVYPHPGTWLTQGDSYENLVQLAVRFDCAFVGPALCRLGRHRWITVGEAGMPFAAPWLRTRCWYCQEPHRG